MNHKNSKTFEVTSSHGCLTVNAETGEVIECGVIHTDCDNCITDITRVDVEEWRNRYPGETPEYVDILDLGTWNTAGEYSGPEEEVRQEIKERLEERNETQWEKDWQKKWDEEWEKRWEKKYNTSSSTVIAGLSTVAEIH